MRTILRLILIASLLGFVALLPGRALAASNPPPLDPSVRKALDQQYLKKVTADYDFAIDKYHLAVAERRYQLERAGRIEASVTVIVIFGFSLAAMILFRKPTVSTDLNGKTAAIAEPAAQKSESSETAFRLTFDGSQMRSRGVGLAVFGFTLVFYGLYLIVFAVPH